LGEVIRLFLISLAIVTTVIMAGVIVQRLVAEGLGILAIVQLLPYGLPIALQYALPATLLFSVCSVFGRMAAENEIVAIKSSGVSPVRVMTPVLILSLLLSPVAVWLNDLAMSWGEPGMNRVVLYSIEEIVYRVLKRDKSYQSQGGFEIAVKGVEDRWLISPMITIRSQTIGNHQTISAEKARLRLNPERETLTIDLVDYQWHDGDSNRFRDGTQHSLEFPLRQAARKSSRSNRPSQFPLREIGGEIRKERVRNQTQQELLVAWCAMGLSVGRPALFDDGPAQHFQWVRSQSEKRLYRLETEPWRRWALGFSCFFFVWFGMPLAIWMRSADYATTFGACFFPILAIYYPIFGMGLDRAKDGAWPPYSVWICNLVMFALGSFLVRRAYRH
jgi:lipopolysaccharide export system permease protein